MKIQTASRNFRNFLGFKELFLALFLTAGYFKADPRLAWLPIDLTLLAATITAGFVMWAFLKHRLRFPVSLLLLLFLFALFLPSVSWTEWHDYAVEKTMRFFTLTLLATVAPVFLIKSQEDLRRFFNALTVFGIIMAIDAFVSLLFEGGHFLRLTAFSSNTIALGRAVGLALVWFSVLALEGCLNSPVALVAIGSLEFISLSAGSRGPLIATAIGILLTFILFQWRNIHQIARLVMIALITVLSVYINFQLVPETSLQRVKSFFEGDFGTSEQLRFQAYALSWEAIQEHPCGVGLGGFATAINLWSDASRQYPHNIFLETFLEGGWFVGIYLIILLAFSFLKAYSLSQKHKEKPEFKGLFAILLFLLVNAAVSGDLNDNKNLFALMGLALGFKVFPHEKA
jgi:O-antigen ligase